MSSNVDTNMNTLASQESLPADEQRIRRLYGNKPLGPLDRFRKGGGGRSKQYFDSGEYAMHQAGKGDTIDVGAMGNQHPSPESIPHPVTPISSNVNGSVPGSKIPGAVLTTGPHISQGSQSAGSPVKETSFLSRETSADDMDDDTVARQTEARKQESAQAAQNNADDLPIRT